MANEFDVSLRSAASPYMLMQSVPWVQATALCLDFLSVNVIGLVAGRICIANPTAPVQMSALLGGTLLVATLFVSLAHASGAYHPKNLLKFGHQIRLVSILFLCAITLVAWATSLIGVDGESSYLFGRTTALLGLTVLVGQRLFWRRLLARTAASGARSRREAIAFGSRGSPLDPSEEAALRRGGIDLIDVVYFPACASVSQVREAAGQLAVRVRGSSVREIVVVLPPTELHLIDSILESLQVLPLPARLLLDRNLSRFALHQVRQFDDLAFVDVKREPLNGMDLASKRFLDLIVASLALVTLAPLIAAAMLAVKLDSPGPVLFRQTRHGFNGRTFKILKLRTMSVMEDGHDIVQATRADARVTRVGYWLRRTSIDELPQLWNVLKGEMSIVGPRPHAVSHDNHYNELIEKYIYRQHVKPGLTGLAQIKGFRGETAEITAMAARVEHDIRYVSNWSIMLDLRIILLTGASLFVGTAY